ncbi:maleylpyruvate isomerase N-terminal domain-containing protein [Mameliella alba]|nr:maleylpyruvate isomerase N-terminal domain-containing protein [Antarctobacter heliothermus]MBY6146420.1 maleylpyruvate isomerase N-terminal domain-containing protein [Mameliella alba]MCA0955819.1 maleylpyruvate isomerase N-terminal domain-containing protein [Mameliella alba]
MSLTEQEAAAREALRARQGAGARYDAPSAPAEALLLARRGTAYFARKLTELPDADLTGPSLRTGMSRAALIAETGYHARAMAECLAAAHSGKPVKLDALGGATEAEIALGATLPARALRSLIHHAAVHLDVEWRDLSDAAWDVALTPDESVTLRDTPLMRARVVWQAAVDLGNGGRILDLPEALRA